MNLIWGSDLHLSCTQEEASSITVCDAVIWLCKGCHWCCCCRRSCRCCCWSWSWRTIFARALLANGTNALAKIVKVVATNLVPEKIRHRHRAQFCADLGSWNLPFPADYHFGQNCTAAPICTIALLPILSKWMPTCSKTCSTKKTFVMAFFCRLPLRFPNRLCWD